MTRLSYSKLSDFETCPRKFWLTYIKKVPFISNKYLIMGRRIHEILHTSTKKKDWRSYLMNHPQKGKYGLMINNYIEYQDNVIEIAGPDTLTHAEVKLRDEEIDLTGVIDRIDKFNGKVLITDYKSDSKISRTKHDRQLLIYSHLYNKKYEDKITHMAPLFLKNEAKIKSKIVTQEKIDEAMKWVIELKKDIESRGLDGVNFPPKINKFCAWCSHCESRLCMEGHTAVHEGPKITEVTTTINFAGLKP